MKESMLNSQDWEMILESLKYSKTRFEEYQGYPSYEFKQKRINEIEQLIAKIKNLKK